MPFKYLHIGGAAAPFAAQTFSLDFDGSTEWLEGAEATIGFADSVTVAAWVKFDNITTQSDTIWSILESPAGNNSIRLFMRNTDDVQLFINSTNTLWLNIGMSVGTWHHLVWVWDTNSFNHLWLDGVDKGSAATGTEVMTEEARTVAFGKADSGVDELLGQGASLAIWNKRVPDAEIVAIYNSGSINFDLNADSGDYVSSADLINWWEIGKQVAPNIGADSAGSYDLASNAAEITDADRVEDVPA